MRSSIFKTVVVGFFAVPALLAQPGPGSGPGFGGDRPPGQFGPPGGGFGGPPAQETKLVKQFDKNNDKVLDAQERKAAREFVVKERAEGRMRGRGPGGGRGPRMEEGEAAKPGKKISPSDVPNYEGKDLYDTSIVRTIFLNFENADWEKEMADFNNTDVEVPAEVIVDGKKYKDVGVHFRGASSYFTVPEGKKRSLNLSVDYAHEDQSIGGYRTLNLLNAHEDPSFLRTVLYMQIAREYLPAPKANFVRVVINGEDWGVYVSAQQFNKEFMKEHFGNADGARFKTPGSPRGQANLAYLGEDADEYKRAYNLKSKNDKKAWQDLIKLTKVLNQTPPEKLKAELEPLLDVDGALKFLALENALVNMDGYWVRTSDYSIAQDAKGRFHILPHDANETFFIAGGPGFGRGGPGGPGGPGGRGPGGPGERREGPGPGGPDGQRPPPEMQSGAPRQLDPLIAEKDEAKPLISKLLAVPEYEQKYLGYTRDIAEKWLDWNKLGPIAEKHQKLIAPLVKEDTKKLTTFENFQKNLTASIEGEGRGPFGGRKIGLKEFADERRAYLLAYPGKK